MYTERYKTGNSISAAATTTTAATATIWQPTTCERCKWKNIHQSNIGPQWLQKETRRRRWRLCTRVIMLDFCTHITSISSNNIYLLLVNATNYLLNLRYNVFILFSLYSKRRKTEKVGKGLRHFSMKVCEKVKNKGTTSYNEVADELVGEFTNPAHMNSLTDQVWFLSLDFNRIKRRRELNTVRCFFCSNMIRRTLEDAFTML